MSTHYKKLSPVNSSITPRFAEVATFMRCPRMDMAPGIDIGLVGVPFDIGTTYRTGTRQGPSAVREMSRLIRQINPSTGVAPFALTNIADIGDIPINPIDIDASVAMIVAFYQKVRDLGIAPISIGGDHTITYPLLKGLFNGEKFGVVHFDAHADTLDSLLGSKVNHATTFRRAVEDGIVDPKRVIQIGLRGTRYSDDDLQYSIDSGMTVITMDDYEEMGRKAVIAAALKTIGDGPTYITFDIDGLDPVHCPGTGVPEPGGLSMRDSQMIIRALTGANIIGGDVCEVCPSLDVAGMTALNAANLMFEIACVTAHAISKRS
jgi:guanidinopropionase